MATLSPYGILQDLKLSPLQMHPVFISQFYSQRIQITAALQEPKNQEKYLKTTRCQEAGLLPPQPPATAQPGPAPLLECVGQPGLVLQGQTQTLGCFQASHQLSLSRKPSTTTAHYKIQQRGKYLAFPRAFSPEVKLLCICNATLEGWAVRAGRCQPCQLWTRAGCCGHPLCQPGMSSGPRQGASSSAQSVEPHWEPRTAQL